MSSDLPIVLDMWPRRGLPVLNDRILRGVAGAKRSLLRAGADLTKNVVRYANDTSLSDQAIGTSLSALGMFVASCICHGMSLHDANVESALDVLGNLQPRTTWPPRDSVYSYMFSNNGRVLRRFTTSRFERVFIDLMRASANNYEHAATVLRCAATPDALLLAAKRGVAAINQNAVLFHNLLNSSPGAISPMWFRKVYKGFFPSFPVAGSMWDPPSGAHLRSALEIDYHLGLIANAADGRVKIAQRYWNRRDTEEFAKAIAVSPFATRIRRQTRGQKKLENGLQELRDTYAHTSGLHWALLKRFAGQTDGDSSGYNVMAHSQVFDILQRRRRADDAVT